MKAVCLSLALLVVSASPTFAQSSLVDAAKKAESVSAPVATVSVPQPTSLADVAAQAKAARQAACTATPATCPVASPPAATVVLTNKDIDPSPVAPAVSDTRWALGTATAKVPTWQIETWKGQLAKYTADLAEVNATLDFGRTSRTVSPTRYATMLEAARPYQATLSRMIGELRASIAAAEFTNTKP